MQGVVPLGLFQKESRLDYAIMGTSLSEYEYFSNTDIAQKH